MASSSLLAIQKKVRRLTNKLSEDQISTADLNEYINTFVLGDFSQNVRLFSLKGNFTFYTQPFVDTYETNTTDVNDPMFDFNNKYTAVHPPAYIAGIPAYYTQYQDVFYANWPKTSAVIDTQLRGDGTTGPFNGTLFTHPILQNSVTFSCLDANGNSMILIDYPVSNEQGALGLVNAPQTLPSPFGSINYVTGDFTLIFPGSTDTGAKINAEVYAYAPGKPLSILYYENKFVLRPVPDQTYSVEIAVDKQPLELIATNQEPLINQWWEYIAYGAAKKVLEDELDYDTIALIEQSLIEQENLVNRSSIMQYANERTVTVYTQAKKLGWWGSNGGWPY